MAEDLKRQIEELKGAQQGLQHVFAQLYKAVDDVLWYH